jgi:hypothetical protein
VDPKMIWGCEKRGREREKGRKTEVNAEHGSNYLDNNLIVRTKCSANNFLDVVNGVEMR